MKHSLLTAFILLLAISSFCQTTETDSAYNFDFEKTELGEPLLWHTIGTPNYTASSDSTIVKSGKYSVVIEHSGGETGFSGWAFSLPYHFDGDKITLSGYIKTENITDGFAGLWMRIDPSIDFDNMEGLDLKGTTDWQKYEITLSMQPKNTEKIILGGLMSGQGKMWLDDLKVSIDGKDIKMLKPSKKREYLAEKDHEFDEGSPIDTIILDEYKLDNLKTLGLIWGFLKYYHPNIARGDYNWDYELFRILPKILDTKNTAGRDSIFVEWISQLGEFDAGRKRRIKSKNIKMMPDLEWLTSSGLSDELSTLLTKVKHAKRTEEHYYIGLAPNVKNPVFLHEDPYSGKDYPDMGFRLLSLFRYWNIIQYYFPYKYLIEEDWKDVLHEFIPKIVQAKDSTTYVLGMMELFVRVRDTHVNIWGTTEAWENYYGQNYAAVELSFVENKAVVTGFFIDTLGAKTGLKPGDIITKVNNKTVEDLINKNLILTPGSNDPAKFRDIANNLLRSNDSIIHLEFNRDGKTEQQTLLTYSQEVIKVYSRFIDTDTCFKIIDEDIAYINNSALKSDYLPEIWDAMKNTRGLVIDVRNYPTDFIIYELSKYLMPEKEVFVDFTRGSISTPGLFTFYKTITTGERNKEYYKGKVVILVNEYTQSSGEYHTMSYKMAPDACVMGSTTAGADGNVSLLYLPGHIYTGLTGIGVYYPDRSETQRIGIVPDIEVHPSIEGIKNGRDEVMEKAIELIMSGPRKLASE